MAQENIPKIETASEWQRAESGLHKRTIKLEDGRYLIFYTLEVPDTNHPMPDATHE